MDYLISNLPKERANINATLKIGLIAVMLYIYSPIIIYSIYAVLTFATCFIWIKSFRFYVLSFYFDYLFENKSVAKMCGIQFENDKDWKTNRKDTHVYMEGIFVEMFSQFAGMRPILTDSTRKAFMRIQTQRVKHIDMEKYFDKIDSNTLIMIELENFLSRSILIETNRVFEIFDAKTQKSFLKYLPLLRQVTGALLGDPKEGMKLMFENRKSIMRISEILKSVPEYKRAFLYVPQLTLITNFSKLIVRKNGDISDFEPHEYLKPISKYSVFVSNGELVFVLRSPDTSNNPSNKAFGPHGVQCPGNKFTFKFIQSIISFLQDFKIDIDGRAVIKGNRFPDIVNKGDIKFTFSKCVSRDKLVIDDAVYEDDE